MARIRSIKPELFTHEELYEAEQASKLPLRLAFSGLFTCCDREGRFRWRPRQLKLDVLPYDENIIFEDVLNALVVHGFIIKYESGEQYYGCIPSWHKHQRVNSKEAVSEFPSVEQSQIISVIRASSTRESTVSHASVTGEASVSHACVTEIQSGNSCLNLDHGEREEEGKGKEGERKGDSSERRREADALLSLSPVIIDIPLNSGGDYPITQLQISQWETLYPAVDILQALRNIRGWNLVNPKKRKTKSGVLSHINTWLAKEQNNAGKQNTFHGNNRAPPYKSTSNLNEQNLRAAEEWIRSSEANVIDGEIVK